MKIVGGILLLMGLAWGYMQMFTNKQLMKQSGDEPGWYRPVGAMVLLALGAFLLLR